MVSNTVAYDNYLNHVIGITDEAARGAIVEEGLVDFEDYLDVSDSDIKCMCARARKPNGAIQTSDGIPHPGAHIGYMQERRLKMLAYYINYCRRVTRIFVVDHATVPLISRVYGIKGLDKDDDLELILPKKLERRDQANEVMESLDYYLLCKRGVDGSPLLYVVRSIVQGDAVDATATNIGHPSFTDEMIDRTDHTLVAFTADNSTVWEIIRHVTYGGPAWMSVSAFARRQSGCEAYRALTEYCIGGTHFDHVGQTDSDVDWAQPLVGENGDGIFKSNQHQHKQRHAKATYVQCAFNLANILMGVGILGLPYVFKVVGGLGGTVCITVFGTITWWTAILIGRQLNGDPRPSSMFTDTATITRMLPSLNGFPDIARAAFGEVACVFLSVILYFELFACLSIFFVSMGDHLHQLIPTVSITTHMVFVSFASLVPTIILRTPALVSYLSMIGTVTTCAVILAVIFTAFSWGNIAAQVAKEEELRDPANIIEPPFHINWKTDGLAVASGIVAYCFSGHAIVPAIYTSMERPHDFEDMVTFTFLLVISCCLAVGMGGYYMFGSTVQDQVTLSLESHSDAGYIMLALTYLMILTIFAKVTITMFPLAAGIQDMIAPYLISERMVALAPPVIKLVVTLLALAVAAFWPSFSFLCSLVGLVCTTTVSVAFPCAAHLKMFGPQLHWAEKLANWVIIVVGVTTGVVGTVYTVKHATK